MTCSPMNATREVKDVEVVIVFSKLESCSMLGCIFAIILELHTG